MGAEEVGLNALAGLTINVAGYNRPGPDRPTFDLT